MDRPAVRIARLEEALAVIRALWSDGPVDLDGPPLPGSRARRVSRSRSSGRTRRSSSAAAVRKVLALAGRHADIVGLNPALAAGVIDAPRRAERHR